MTLYLSGLAWTLCASSYMSFVFFFSSRRRHTRSTRDWSSDVCSSDLRRFAVGDEVVEDAAGLVGQQRVLRGAVADLVQVVRKERSEERRVGKECRSGWWGED